jgi:hypothetical protein
VAFQALHAVPTLACAGVAIATVATITTVVAM